MSNEDEDVSAEVQFFPTAKRTKKTDAKDTQDSSESISFEQPDIGGALSKEEETVGKVLVAAVAGITLLILIIILYFVFGNNDASNTISSSASTPTEQVISGSPQEITKQRLQKISRYTKAWMIQFGSGFKPKQVTFKVLQLDMDLKNRDLVDGWGQKIIYEPTDTDFSVRSSGPDKKAGNEDDVLVKVTMN